MVRRRQLDARVGLDRCASLRDNLTVDRHLPGEDQRARPLPRRREAAIDEHDVQPRALGHVGEQDFTATVTLATW